MKSWIAAIALGTAGLSLAACADEAETETETAADPLSVTDARLFLPAAEGRPGAAYFELTNDSDRTVVVRAAAVEGAARTELHDYSDFDPPTMGEISGVTLEAGETVSFEPGGKHVMAYEIAGLEAGGTTRMTLTIVGGESVEFDAEIRAAGDDR